MNIPGCRTRVSKMHQLGAVSVLLVVATVMLVSPANAQTNVDATSQRLSSVPPNLEEAYLSQQKWIQIRNEAIKQQKADSQKIAQLKSSIDSHTPSTASPAKKMTQVAALDRQIAQQQKLEKVADSSIATLGQWRTYYKQVKANNRATTDLAEIGDTPYDTPNNTDPAITTSDTLGWGAPADGYYPPAGDPLQIRLEVLAAGGFTY